MRYAGNKILIALTLTSMNMLSDKNFLTAEWRKLLLINYAVDPALLLPYLPYKTELDFWKGKAYVSLVGFRFINTRLKGWRIPFHSSFEEINLRFYVRYRDGDEWKRGVCFIKEIVPRPTLTLVANSFYRENYVTCPTRHRISLQEDALEISYSWKHKGQWDKIEVRAASEGMKMAEGSEEEFITEHYWGYTKLNENLTSEYQVAHPRWMTYPVLHYSLNVRFGDLYGNEFGMLKDMLPDSVMLAEGSQIAVKSARKIR